MKLNNSRGFSLLEVLLVTTIVSSLLYMGLGYMQAKIQRNREDLTVVQMQSILNATLAYYVKNGKWPNKGTVGTGHNLVTGGGFLPNRTIYSPWGGNTYSTYYDPTNVGRMHVFVKVGSTASAIVSANNIANRLPLGYTSTVAGSSGAQPDSSASNKCDPASPITCYLDASVNIPPQVLNVAGSTTFAGLYHHGACVPEPVCPIDSGTTTMTPQVFIIPVSVSGVNDSNSSAVYPISSFTGYASSATTSSNPAACPGGTQVACNASSDPASQKYWRACMQVVTERGDVSGTNSAASLWGQYVTLAAFTRCAITNEPSGSNFSVYTH